MVWLWILAVIILLIALLCWTRVGVWAAFAGGELRLDVIFGLLRVHILPARPKKPGTEKPKKEKKAAKNPVKPRLKPSFTLEDGSGANTVQVERGRIRISAADCPDQVCVKQGWISGGAVPIICLPHRLTIEIVDGGGGLDGAAG